MHKVSPCNHLYETLPGSSQPERTPPSAQLGPTELCGGSMQGLPQPALTAPLPTTFLHPQDRVLDSEPYSNSGGLISTDTRPADSQRVSEGEGGMSPLGRGFSCVCALPGPGPRPKPKERRQGPTLNWILSAGATEENLRQGGGLRGPNIL